VKRVYRLGLKSEQYACMGQLLDHYEKLKWSLEILQEDAYFVWGA